MYTAEMAAEVEGGDHAWMVGTFHQRRTTHRFGSKRQVFGFRRWKKSHHPGGGHVPTVDGAENRCADPVENTIEPLMETPDPTFDLAQDLRNVKSRRNRRGQ